MPVASGVKVVLSQADRQEREYNWLEAIGDYRKALRDCPPKDFSTLGDIHERVGYAFHRAAMQSETKTQFRSRCIDAVKHYEEARLFFAKAASPLNEARISRCKANIAYLGYWLTANVPEKRELLDECWRLTQEALKQFETADDAREYGQTYNQLSVAAYFAFCLSWDFKARQKMMEEAAKCGEQAVRFLSSFEDNCEYVKALVKTAGCFELLGFYFLDLDERDGYYQKASNYWLKANQLSKETAQVELLHSAGMAVWENPDWMWGADQTLTNYETALKYGIKTKDRLVIGFALDWLAWHTLYNAEACEDPDRMMALFERALQYAEDARKQYSTISYVSPLWGSLWAEAPYAEYYSTLSAYQADPKARREALEKAVEAAADYLELAQNSGYPDVVFYAHVVLSRSLFSLAKSDTHALQKRELLGKALDHNKEAVRLIEKFVPFFYWKRGLLQTVLADIKSELAVLTKDSETKKNMFREAATDKEKSVQFGLEYVVFLERRGSVPSIWVRLGDWQYGHGDLLNRLYELANDTEHLRKAVHAFQDAAESFQKLELTSRIAECRWKSAQIYDLLGDHMGAAQNFDLASASYRKTADKIHQLKDFYLEHALYMQAWSEIEKAKLQHKKHEYDQASEHFEKAAKTHESLRQWNYLAANYWAWANVARAEELSRDEQSEEALRIFEQAAELFNQAKRSIQANLNSIESLDEKQMATRILVAAESRKEYCLARIALEEARDLDKKGDHITSSEKYASAEEKLQRIVKQGYEPSRKEMQQIIQLCKAWQKMTMAEAKSSTELYGEAAKLFEQARQHMVNESTSLLTLGHSSLCKALKAGTEYENSRDPRMYSTSKRHMEAAANYYAKAGFKNGSEYVRATQHLFDTYMYLSKAQTETEPRRRAQYYQMAEKLLQVSAGSYLKAKYSEKSEEVRKLLERVKVEKQLALSLTEVLHAPMISSTTASFSTPIPAYEKAVGLEKFEHANIQAHLTASEEVTVGEELEIQVDLVNVAKTFGLLVRAENVIPSCFRLVKLPAQYELQNGSLNLKGKRLEPLKVETLKILVEATDAGTVYLCPKVVYTDDEGNFRTCRSEAVQVTVHPPLVFKFKTDAAKKAFDYLIQEFVQDYMKRRLVIQEAGWRSLVQIAKNSGVSLRSVYGDARRRGVAISELERRGLIETRIFPKSKGRGGKTTKARISYDKETIKRYVDSRVAYT